MIYKVIYKVASYMHDISMKMIYKLTQYIKYIHDLQSTCMISKVAMKMIYKLTQYDL